VEEALEREEVVVAAGGCDRASFSRPIGALRNQHLRPIKAYYKSLGSMSGTRGYLQRIRDVRQ
jgi:hypothetical protein